jgi:hypothetical protein
MSKVKTTIYLVLFLALVNIATPIRLRAQTTTQIDIKTTLFKNNNEAQNKCPGVCSAKGLRFNGNWDTKSQGNERYAVCGCHAKTIDVQSQKFRNNNVAKSLCPGVCSAEGLTFTGGWDNKRSFGVCQCK